MSKFFKWTLGIFILLVLILVFFVLYTIDKKQKIKEKEEVRQQMSGFAITMSPDQLQKAEAALQNGIKIDDARGDFVADFKLIVPANQILQFDAKSVEYGADDQYFYRKCSYWGVSPKDLVLADHDDIQMGCISSLYIDRLQNVSTKYGKGQSHMLSTCYDYAEKMLGIELYLNIPESMPEEEWDFPGSPHAGLKRPFGGLIYGGTGYDYVLAAWPLSELGLKPNDAVTIFSSTEEGAKGDGTHFAVDMVPQGNQKDGTKVKWTLGQKDYQILKME